MGQHPRGRARHPFNGMLAAGEIDGLSGRAAALFCRKAIAHVGGCCRDSVGAGEELSDAPAIFPSMHLSGLRPVLAEAAFHAAAAR